MPIVTAMMFSHWGWGTDSKNSFGGRLTTGPKRSERRGTRDAGGKGRGRSSSNSRRLYSDHHHPPKSVTCSPAQPSVPWPRPQRASSPPRLPTKPRSLCSAPEEELANLSPCSSKTTPSSPRSASTISRRPRCCCRR